MNKWLDQVYWNNTVLAYLIAAGAIILAWLILAASRRWIIRFLKKLTSRTNTNFDDLLVQGVERFALPYAYLTINYHIITQLTLPVGLSRVLSVAIMVISAWYVIRLINFIIHGAILVYMRQKNEPEERIRQLNGILMIVKAIIWGLGIVMLIDNLGYDVTTIIAGLGVGGIAIALAAQNILGDLFSYLVIFFDKPFEVGDFVISGTFSGTVEKIGIKTSHVRSPDGQQLVMPNAEMVKTVIQNYKRLQRRRVVFSVGVVYNTQAAMLRKIPGMIEEIIRKQEKATFDRAHLKTFGDFSINFEVSYFIESSDFLIYMNTHQSISFLLFEKFEQEQIEFAFPTQTIYISKTDSDKAA